MCDKHMRKKKLGIYSDAAIAEREAKEKQGA
jgi:2-keto-3-deoxygluconate permease